MATFQHARDIILILHMVPMLFPFLSASLAPWCGGTMSTVQLLGHLAKPRTCTLEKRRFTKCLLVVHVACCACGGEPQTTIAVAHGNYLISKTLVQKRMPHRAPPCAPSRCSFGNKAICPLQITQCFVQAYPFFCLAWEKKGLRHCEGCILPGAVSPILSQPMYIGTKREHSGLGTWHQSEASNAF